MEFFKSINSLNLLCDLNNFITDAAEDRKRLLLRDTEMPGLYVSPDDFTAMAVQQYMRDSDLLDSLNLSDKQATEIVALFDEYVTAHTVDKPGSRQSLISMSNFYNISADEMTVMLNEIDALVTESHDRYNSKEIYNVDEKQWDMGTPELARLIYESAIAAGFEDADALHFANSTAMHRLMVGLSGGDVMYQAESGTRSGLAGLPREAYQAYFAGAYYPTSATMDAKAFMKFFQVNFGNDIRFATEWMINQKEWGTLPPGNTY